MLDDYSNYDPAMEEEFLEAPKPKPAEEVIYPVGEFAAATLHSSNAFNFFALVAGPVIKKNRWLWESSDHPENREEPKVVADC
jgi:hypothetical protein